MFNFTKVVSANNLKGSGVESKLLREPSMKKGLTWVLVCDFTNNAA